uniref:Uncharacterized protein n=1 Tax=Alexandrium monilatum TaxID=311494 RepID=A0A7S4STC9_9DINO
MAQAAAPRDVTPAAAIGAIALLVFVEPVLAKELKDKQDLERARALEERCEHQMRLVARHEQGVAVDLQRREREEEQRAERQQRVIAAKEKDRYATRASSPSTCSVTRCMRLSATSTARSSSEPRRRR